MTLPLDGIANLAGGVSNLINGVLDRVWPNPSDEIKTQLETLKIELAAVIAVHATNQAEANHPSIFVAGWRPWCGWIGGFGLCYQFLFQPLLTWASINFSIMAPPALDTGTLTSIVLAMLGMGAMRSYDKKNGNGNGKRD